MHFITLSAFIASAHAIATFGWNCTNSLGPCNNACYAVHQNLAPSVLTYDANVANRNPRRTASGCNRTPCTNTNYKKYGDSCDEFPFASTKEGGKNAILRCVDSTENSSEGGQLSKNLYPKLKDGDQFNIAIEDWKGAAFCETPTKANDGSEFKLVNGAFANARLRRDDVGFVDAEARDTPSAAPFRQFLDENGSFFLSLNRELNLVGEEITKSDGTTVKIVKEM